MNSSPIIGIIIVLGLIAWGVAKKLQKNISSAELVYARIVQMINKTQSELKPDEQLAVLSSAAGGETLSIEAIGFINPDLIVLTGKDSQDNVTQTVLHFSCVQVSCKKIKTAKPPKVCTIGFRGECS